MGTYDYVTSAAVMRDGGRYYAAFTPLAGGEDGRASSLKVNHHGRVYVVACCVACCVAWRGVGACVYGVSIDCVLCIYCVVQEIDRYCTLYTVHFFLSLC